MHRSVSLFLAGMLLALLVFGAMSGAQAGGDQSGIDQYQTLAAPMSQDGSIAVPDGSQTGTTDGDQAAVTVGTIDPSAQYDSAASLPMATAQSTAERIVGEDQAYWYGPGNYWHRTTGFGWNGHMVWTYVNGSAICNSICWRSGLPSGNYTVYAFVPRNYATTQNARYNVEYYVGNTWYRMNIVGVNQNNYYDAWVSLGNYNFPGEPAVYLGDDTGESYGGTHRMVGFSAVKFVWNVVPPKTDPPKTDPPKTDPTPAPSGVPCFYQGDSNWSLKRLGTSACTMGKYGCLVTALASVANWGGYGTDPGKMCDWLSSHSGFASNGNLLSHTKLNEYTGNKVVWTGGANWRSVAANLNQIKSELDAGRPVVLEVHYQNSTSEKYMHWVVAVSYTLSGSQVSDILIMDPMNSGKQYVSLKQKYAYGGSLTKWIYYADFYKRN